MRGTHLLVVAVVFLRAADDSAFSSVVEPPVSVPSSEPMELDVLFYDSTVLLNEEQKVLQDEVGTILAKPGISVRWLPTDCYQQDTSTLPLRVVLLDKEPTYLGLRDAVIGATAGARFEERYVFLFYPAILRALELEPSSEIARTGRGREMIARAVGRVLVHELVHVLAPGRAHAETGLMRSRFTKKTLVAPEVALDRDSLRALVAGTQRFRQRVATTSSHTAHR